MGSRDSENWYNSDLALEQKNYIFNRKQTVESAFQLFRIWVIEKTPAY